MTTCGSCSPGSTGIGCRQFCDTKPIKIFAFFLQFQAFRPSLAEYTCLLWTLSHTRGFLEVLKPPKVGSCAFNELRLDMAPGPKKIVSLAS